MNKNWVQEPLAKNAYIKGRIGWRGLKANEYKKEGPFLIAGNHINNGRIDWNRCDHINLYRYNESWEIALKEKDIILTKDGTIGRIAFIDKLPGLATINSTMMLIRVRAPLLAEFVYHYLNSASFQKIVEDKVSGSSIPHIFQEDMKRLKIPVPSETEQRQIARILDTLDEAIQKTEQLIAKLKAIKQGLLHDLLTRGLDENGRLRDPVAHPEQFKPSPLGPIPKEWEIKEIGELATLEYGAGLTENKRSGIGYPVYGSNGIVGYHDTFLIQGPGIIVGRKGSVGSIHWSSDSFWPIDTTYYVNAKEEIGLRWFYWALQYSDLDRLDSSTGVPGLNRNDAYKIKLYKPKYSEQNQIASILDTLENTIAKHEQNYLSKLRLLKKGLMHDLLTGKVRVNIKEENRSQTKGGNPL